MARMQTFDAVIVGSGASGGWVAKQLTEAGLRVAVLEAAMWGASRSCGRVRRTASATTI